VDREAAYELGRSSLEDGVRLLDLVVLVGVLGALGFVALFGAPAIVCLGGTGQVGRP
jgi:hypothetical protein